MSIYSGFATRFQEESYDHCIDSLLYILQKRIIKFYQGEQAEEDRFIELVLKLHQQMKNMEKNKYLDPKSSNSVNELIKFMQVYQHNSTAKLEQSNVKMPEQLPVIDHKTMSMPEPTIQKKKSIYWVEKSPNPDSTANLQSAEAAAQEGADKDKKAVSREKDRTEFRKTSYNSSAIRGIRLKNTSRTNLSRQPKYEPPAPPTSSKNRSNSHYLSENPNILHSKVTYYAQPNHTIDLESNATRKRKNKSSLRHDPPADTQSIETRNEVSDIIKEYITKAKKNYLRGHHVRESRETAVRLHDF